MEQYAGYDCVKISNSALMLWVTRQVGPRIIGLELNNSGNLFAVLPDARYPHEDGSVYSFRGGHRLWTSPELPEITYLPDDQPVQIEELESGIQVIQPLDEISGLQKQLSIRLAAEDNQVVIDHQISNLGAESIELAAWAITQLRPGGVGILPQYSEKTDPHGLHPNRSMAFWPYSDLQSKYFTAGNRYLLVDASFDSGAFKIGFVNPNNWLGYLNQGILFIKQAAYLPGARYGDFGSSSECYCCPSFIELETLSPLTNLKSGESVSHQETWQVYDQVDLELATDKFEDQIERLVQRLKF